MTVRHETIAMLGDTVLCDWCNKNWTTLPESGGFMFGSKATCPDCAPGLLADAKAFDEERFIMGRCPDDVSFADWVRTGRGPEASVECVSCDTPEELLAILDGKFAGPSS